MRILNEHNTNSTFPVSLVVSRFNAPITEKLLEGALDRLKERDFAQDQIEVLWVPGAVEIPLVAQKLAQAKKSKAIICLGAVIRGETSHYDYVCQQVSEGIQKVALDFQLPVIFGVLTTEDGNQARARVGGSRGHKGKEAVDAACEMVALLDKIES